MVEKLINLLYHNKLIAHIFHTLVFCLKRELKDCNSVLDLGCGPDSPLKYCNIPYSIGVDVFEHYIEVSISKAIHNKYILSNISELDFKPSSFDAVILMEILEHFTKEDGLRILEKAEKWAKKKIIVSTPNDYLIQDEINHNPYQVHLSGWTYDEMRKLGYKAYGMAGLKFLRKEKDAENLCNENLIFSTIRFRPKLFWLIISEFSQLVTYFISKLAFEIFYVKRKI